VIILQLTNVGQSALNLARVPYKFYLMFFVRLT
jgi:hypothetical protein